MLSRGLIYIIIFLHPLIILGRRNGLHKKVDFFLQCLAFESLYKKTFWCYLQIRPEPILTN